MRRFFTLLFVGFVMWAIGAQFETAKKVSSPMDSVLLKDYQPDSSLVVPVTPITRARFQVIDFHSHVYVKTPAEIANWVRIMDEVGVATVVIQTGASGAKFDKLVDLFLRHHPGRFQLYCGIETHNSEAADYPQQAAAELQRCYDKGARGVGEVIDKGSGLTEGPLLPRSKRLHPDDPRLDPFWKKCAELNLPVSLHMADHPSAWRAPDKHQERLPEYQEYNQFGKDVPSYEEMISMRNRTLRRHPETLFVLCHLANQGNDLASLAKLLAAYPHIYVDISGRGYELGRQPRFAAQFLARYKDRVLFGTDQHVNGRKEMYIAWWRLLELPDEYLPSDVGWRLYGMDLSSEVLKQIYRNNAQQILNWKDVERARGSS